jgi:hypothetical protein
MTTKNEILTASIDSVLYIPLDCVQSNDSISYVYVTGAKRQVILGQSNENEVIVKAGLEKDEEIYLVPPSDAESYDLEELDPAILEKFLREESQPIAQKGPGMMNTGDSAMKGMSKEDFEKPQKGDAERRKRGGGRP